MSYSKTCATCGRLFEFAWPNGLYCSRDCRAQAIRQRAREKYSLDPRTDLDKQREKLVARRAARWARILAEKGDECSRCHQSFPVVVYDLHHPNGKASRKETPAIVIAQGSEEAFEKLLRETVLTCANCHRLTHADAGDWAPGRERVYNCAVCGAVVRSKSPTGATCGGPECRAVFMGMMQGKGAEIQTGAIGG